MAGRVRVNGDLLVNLDDLADFINAFYDWTQQYGDRPLCEWDATSNPPDWKCCQYEPGSGWRCCGRNPAGGWSCE